MSDFVEDVCHVAKMGGRKYWVEQLTLPLVLIPNDREQTRTECRMHRAVKHDEYVLHITFDKVVPGRLKVL